MKVRYTARGALTLGALGVTLKQGDVDDLPSTVVDRYADRFEVLANPDPPPPPPDVDASEFHVGGGWYDLGDGVKVRKAEAEARLADGS